MPTLLIILQYKIKRVMITSNITKSISVEDQVFASIIVQGKTLHTLTASNFSNTNEIIKLASKNFKNYRGLAHLYIRNQTQGWSMTILLSINSTNTTPETQNYSPRLDGKQYTLPF